jgi:ligand-binding SRPBCC domain-containing protein
VPRVHILERRQIEMGVGMLIEYRLRRFVDVQVTGSYSLWEHTREFEEDGPGVRRDLRQIFDHRRDAVARELG